MVNVTRFTGNATFFDTHSSGRTPVWKEASHEGDYNQDPVEALKQAGGNYRTEKVPLFYEIQGQRFDTGQVGLIRGRTPFDDDRRFVGIAAARYEPVQHSEFARACRPISERYHLSLVTLAGKQREHLYLAFDLGDYPVGGIESEMVRQYLYGGNCNDGGTGISLSVKTERLRCQNQLPTFFNKSTFTVRVRHSAEALLTTQQWVKYLEQVQLMAKQQQEQFDRMIVTNVVMEDIIAMVEAAYPMPHSRQVEQFVDGNDLAAHLPTSVRERAQQLESARDRTERLRTAAYRSIERTGDEAPVVAGTAYGAFNGITYEESWRTGRGAGESLLFGGGTDSRAARCQRAFEVGLRLAGVN